MKKDFIPNRIFIDNEALNSPVTTRILKHFKEKVPFETVNHKDFYDKNKANLKACLYLTINRGDFVKKCPGTNGFVCCDYFVIDLVENCHLGCSYCFLKTYLRDELTKIYVNVDKLFYELSALIDKDKSRLYRIGTGELSDSLALDDITGFSTMLVNYFKDKDNALLELKTKTNKIDNLLSLKHSGKTVVSWSLNPSSIIENEELYAASLDERIESALILQKHGYQLAFHFDPIIYYEGWEKGYKEVIDKLFSHIDTNSIAWISIGGLRFPRSLQDPFDEKQSAIFHEEFLASPDGKMRYFIKIREKLYKTLISMLKEKDDKLFIYLCMEGKHMWKRIFNFVPRSALKLDKLFEKRQSVIS